MKEVGWVLLFLGFALCSYGGFAHAGAGRYIESLDFTPKDHPYAFLFAIGVFVGGIGIGVFTEWGKDA